MGNGDWFIPAWYTNFINQRTFPIVLQKEKEGGYSVSSSSVALKGCYSQGETIEDALRNIREATFFCLEDAETVPESTEVSLHISQLSCCI